MEAITFLIAIVALIMANDARGRVKRLEEGRSSENTRPTFVATPTTPRQSADSMVHAAPLTAQTVPVPHQNSQVPAQAKDAAVPVMIRTQMAAQEPSFDLVEWFKHDWLMKLGAFFVLLAFGWFVSYAFINGWVGPYGKIALGLFAGTGLLALGWWRMIKYPEQGSIFIALGAGVNLLVVFAAQSLYEMFTPGVALLFMFATSAFVAYVSALYRNQTLSILGVVLAGLAPLLTGSRVDNDLLLFSYLLVVVCGALFVAFVTRFGAPTLTALAVVSFFSSKFVGAHILDEYMFLFGMIFATLFFWAGIVRAFRRGTVLMSYDLVLACGNALLLLFYIYTFVPTTLQSLVTAAWTVVFVIGSFITLRVVKNRAFFMLYASIGVVYLGVATAFELDGQALTIAFALEGIVLVLFSLFALKNVDIARYSSLTLALPSLLALGEISSPAWKEGVLHAPMFTLLTVGAALMTVGLLLQRIHTKVGEASSTLGLWQVPLSMLFFFSIAFNAFMIDMLVPLYFFTLLCAALPMSVRLVTGDVSFSDRYAVALFAPSALALGSLVAPAWKDSIFHNHALGILILVGALSVTVYERIARGVTTEVATAWYETSSGWFAAIATAYVAAFVWLATHAYLSIGQAVALSLIIYVVCGLALYLRGLQREIASLRAYGAAILGVAFARLLLIDVWTLDLPWRIVTFLIIGVLLLSTAFMGRVKKGAASVAIPTESDPAIPRPHDPSV